MKIISKFKDAGSINYKCNLLKKKIANKSKLLDQWQGRLVNYAAPETYENPQQWQTVSIGNKWHQGNTLKIKSQIEIGKDFNPDKTFLHMKFDRGEAIISIDGEMCGSIDREHHFVQIPAKCITAGVAKIEAEVWLNNAHRIPGGIQQGPVTFETSELVEFNEDVWKCYLNVSLVIDLFELMTHEDQEFADILQTILHDTLYKIEYEAETNIFTESVRIAHNYLQKELKKVNQPSRGRFFYAGHTHLDIAWLWPFRETIRKAARSFLNALNLIEKFPEYTFSCSQGYLFAIVKKYYPDIYQRVKKAVKTGRIEPLGPFWVEPDINIPSGESLIRQILYGHQFFNEEFGGYTSIGWLPDAFGFSPALPQILKRSGIDHLLTTKVYYEAETEFPHRVFEWEGLDGSKVLAHTPWLGMSHLYNCDPDPAMCRDGWKNFTNKDSYDATLIPYGYGDGGGGATPQQVQKCIYLKDMPAIPNGQFSTVKKYFEDFERNAKDLSRWYGDLYVECHQGTFTSQGWNKMVNRQAEQLYRQAEIFSTLSLIAGRKVDTTKLKEGWLLLLTNQFHDVITGTSIPEVYVESKEYYLKVNQIGKKILEESINSLSEQFALDGAEQGLCVFNPNSWQRSDVIEIEWPANGNISALETADEKILPVQLFQANGDKKLFVVEIDDVPAFGSRHCRPAHSDIRPLPNELTVRTDCMENRFFRIDLDKNGLIEQIADKTSGTNFMEHQQRANLFKLFRETPIDEEAWNIDPAFEEHVEDITELASIEVIESGPVRGVLRIIRKFGDSQISQDIIIYRKKAIIDFRTHVIWQQRYKLLKVSFPTNLKTQHATYEVAYGCYEQPTHQNTAPEKAKFEVAAHRFADISENSRGMSLLNNCKYGINALGGEFQLSLLRSPTFPDPNSDIGEHDFTYSLYIHKGISQRVDVVQRATELNSPMQIRTGGFSPETHGFISVKPDNVIIEVLKEAEDGNGIIMRAYECCGARTVAEFDFGFALSKIQQCDLLERPEKKITLDGNGFISEFGPFEIKTFILNLS